MVVDPNRKGNTVDDDNDGQWRLAEAFSRVAHIIAHVRCYTITHARSLCGSAKSTSLRMRRARLTYEMHGAHAAQEHIRKPHACAANRATPPDQSICLQHEDTRCHAFAIHSFVWWLMMGDWLVVAY